jgi:hypothetical protein
MKGKTVISTSTRKNISMVVYHNIDADGKKYSVTKHERLRSDRPEYRRFYRKHSEQSGPFDVGATFSALRAFAAIMREGAK